MSPPSYYRVSCLLLLLWPSRISKCPNQTFFSLNENKRARERENPFSFFCPTKKKNSKQNFCYFSSYLQSWEEISHKKTPPLLLTNQLPPHIVRLSKWPAIIIIIIIRNDYNKTLVGAGPLLDWTDGLRWQGRKEIN